jgi:hypothetical protein
MHSLTFQFSTSVECSSALIRWRLGSLFSHLDFVLGDGTCLGVSDSPDAPVVTVNGAPQGSPRGVAIRPPDYQEFGIRRRLTIETDKANAVLTAALSQLGKPFDHFAMRSLLWPPHWQNARDWRDTGQWFCSEYCTWSCECGKLWSYPLLVPPSGVTPPMFLLLVNPFIRSVAQAEAFWKPVDGLKLGAREQFFS